MNDLIQRQNDLIAKRDEINNEIKNICLKRKESFVKEIINLGIFKSKWKYVDDIDYCYSKKPYRLFLSDYKLAEAIKSISKKHNYKFCSIFDDYVCMTFHDQSVELSFSKDCDVAKFIAENNISVDFSIMDNKIASIEKLRKEIIG